MELIAPVFGTKSTVLPVHTTGRGAMEAAICNLFSQGDEIAVCCNGKFGELWASLAESYGLVVHRISTEWDRDVDAAEVAGFLASHPRLRGVALAYCDTSTGVRNDVASVARVVREHGPDTLVLVDGVSSLGGMPFSFDEWGVDLAVTASQKCLMSSPGLAFAALSERAWTANARAGLPRNYWDFAATRQHVSRQQPETPGTPPVHIVLQVTEALRILHEEGLVKVQRRARGHGGTCPASHHGAWPGGPVPLPAASFPDAHRHRASGCTRAEDVARQAEGARYPDGGGAGTVPGHRVPHRPHGRHPHAGDRAHARSPR